MSLLFEHACSVVSLGGETTNILLLAHVLNPSLCQEIKTNSNATRAIPQSRYLETDLSSVSCHVTSSLDKGTFLKFLTKGLFHWSTPGIYSFDIVVKGAL